MKNYDVVVVGQGVVGAAAALGLHLQGLSVAIVDPYSPPSWSEDKHDNRVFAISPASMSLLHRLGVWSYVCAARVSPYTCMEIWDEGGVGALSLSAADANVPELGYIVENSLLCQALADSLEPLDRFRQAVKIVSAGSESDHGQITLAGGQRLGYKLLIGADGANSFVRKALGIQVQSRAYKQRGIVATVTTAREHRDTAWQRFLSTGPLALLPLADGRSSIVWSAEDQLADELMALADDEFLRRLTVAADGALGEIQAVEGRACFPLWVRQASDYYLGNAVLVGDAAHTIHPLAGLGVNLGLGDVEELLLMVEGAAGLAELPPSKLRRYQRCRRSENMKLAVVTDGLNRLFSNNNAGLGLLRGQGMKASMANGFIRKQLIINALGL
jgi:ubiquinone biosynthesis UbiH/UbiF/VisC/COQ6 family hydroxylase